MVDGRHRCTFQNLTGKLHDIQVSLCPAVATLNGTIRLSKQMGLDETLGISSLGCNGRVTRPLSLTDTFKAIEGSPASLSV